MSQHCFTSRFIHSGVDRAAKTIHGVSVASVGEAKGHNIYLDDTTLKQLKSCAETYKGGLKVKADHGSGVFSTMGLLKNFSLDGNQLRADFEVFGSSAEMEKLFDMAEKIPDTFGFSVAFSGEDQTIGKKLFARCEEIYSADLVSEPAANPTGLFSVKKSTVDLSAVTSRLRQFAINASAAVLRQFGGPGSGPREGEARGPYNTAKAAHEKAKASLKKAIEKHSAAKEGPDRDAEDKAYTSKKKAADKEVDAANKVREAANKEAAAAQADKTSIEAHNASHAAKTAEDPVEQVRAHEVASGAHMNAAALYPKGSDANKLHAQLAEKHAIDAADKRVLLPAVKASQSAVELAQAQSSNSAEATRASHLTAGAHAVTNSQASRELIKEVHQDARQAHLDIAGRTHDDATMRAHVAIAARHDDVINSLR